MGGDQIRISCPVCEDWLETSYRDTQVRCECGAEVAVTVTQIK